MADTIGRRVRAWRDHRGYSMRELASRAHCAPSTIHRLEHDRTTDPPVLQLMAIAKALGVPLANLLPPELRRG